MKLFANLDHLYEECKKNQWLRYFTVFCRVALALGFIPSPLECTNGCAGNTRPEACGRFCNCIYNEGNPLGKCLEEYRRPVKDERK